MHTSNSSIPPILLRCYIFYSRLEKHFKDPLTLELENWTAPDEISIKNTEWRSQSRVVERKLGIVPVAPNPVQVATLKKGGLAKNEKLSSSDEHWLEHEASAVDK